MQSTPQFGVKRDVAFPSDSVEATQPHLFKQKRMIAKDISKYRFLSLYDLSDEKCVGRGNNYV